MFIIVGQINRKAGARLTSGVCMILAGLAYIGVGNAVNLPMYTVCMCVVVGGVMSAGYISGGDLVTQWFPKKKGIVMGYTTMGHNLASAAFVPLITLLVGRMGIGKGVLPISITAIVLRVVGLILVRNTPQERGMNPDNVSDEVYRNEYYHGPKDNDGGWTTKKLLRTTRRPARQIAGEVGYYSQSYFTKLFIDKVGCTPAEYRASGAPGTET